MGIVATRPYIIDEFDSDEDYNGVYESTCESYTEPALLNAASVPVSVQSEESSDVTSSWPSKTPEEISEKLSSILQQQQNGDVGDLNDNDDAQRKALAQLDEELIQFEANEEKVSNEPPVLHSGIPRLKSGSLRSARSAGFGTDISKRSPTERKRSPSPHGNRPSGIPRYSWAHVAPVSPGISLGENQTEGQTLDASSLSNTLESLSDRRRTSSNKSNSTSEYSGGICQCMKTTGNSPQWDINVSDLTGRVKMKKKHTGLPSLWTKADGPQRLVKTPYMNESQHGISSSASSDMANEEMATCRAIEEWGGLSVRKVLDLRRWYCISRPQYKTSCGISAVVSCWNYLFSTMGYGCLPPVTQETAMKLLGFTSPFDNINFGPVTGNQTVLRWFSELNTHFNVNGRCFIMYKPSGKNQTISVTEQMALDSLKKGLKDPSTTFIYHCHNHYFCPIGYEDTSEFCVDAYKSDIGENVESWVLFGDTGRKHSPINCQSWEKICIDLNCKSPSYFNIRQIWKGVMQRKSITTVGENLHCIMTFQRVNEQLPSPPSSVTSSASTTSSLSVVNSSRLPFRPNSSSKSPTRHSPGMRSAVDTHRPELGNQFETKLEDEEVGCENLESDNSEDDVVEIGREVKEKKIIDEKISHAEYVIKIKSGVKEDEIVDEKISHADDVNEIKSEVKEDEIVDEKNSHADEGNEIGSEGEKSEIVDEIYTEDES